MAMLVGPDAPLAMDPAWKSSFSDNAIDFCKPACEWVQTASNVRRVPKFAFAFKPDDLT